LTQQLRGLETQTRILAAAADCFTHAGYDATGVAEICTRAGVSKGAFYHHFASKQAVFLALFNAWIADLEAVMQGARTPDKSAPEQLVALAGMVQQVLDAATGQLPIFLEFWRQATKEPDVWQVTIEPYRRFRTAFAALVNEGVAAGSLRPVNPELAAHVLVSLGVGLALQGVLDPDGAEWRGAADQAIQLLLTGLGVQKAYEP
jgi:AcrR family transcriptional regulator